MAGRLLLVAVGVILAVGVAEALFTVANVAPPRRPGRPWGLRNEIYGWGYRPGATFTYDGTYEKFGAPGRINAHGLREREYTYEKPAGVFRVLVLGDSLTASLEVPLEQTFHELLETELNKAHGPGRVEVIAAAIQGWSTDQEYLYYVHEGFKYDPDLVLVQFYANDIYGNGVEVQRLTRVPTETDKPFFALDQGRLTRTDPFRTEQRAPTVTGGPLTRGKAFLRDHLRTYRLIAQMRRASRSNRAPRAPFCYQYDGIPPELYTYAPEFPPEYQAAWAVTDRLFAELKAETSKRGQRLAVFYMPDRRQVLPGQWQKTIECWPAVAGASWDLDKPNRALAATLQQLQTPYLDPTETFRRRAGAGQSIYFETDWHLNPEGHGFVSTLLRDWLRNASLVPR